MTVFENSSEASNAEIFIKKQKSRNLKEDIIENGWSASDPINREGSLVRLFREIGKPKHATRNREE